MQKMKSVFVAAAALCLAPSLAYANNGFYGLGGIGRHTTEIKTANAAAAAVSTDMSTRQRAELFARAGAGRMKVSVQPDGAAKSSRSVGGNMLAGQRSFVRGE